MGALCINEHISAKQCLHISVFGVAESARGHKGVDHSATSEHTLDEAAASFRDVLSNAGFDPLMIHLADANGFRTATQSSDLGIRLDKNDQ